MSGTILVLNAGSSSIKFQLFATAAGEGVERRIKGEVEGIGSRPHLTAEARDGKNLVENMKDVPPEDLAALPKDGASQIDHYIYGLPKRA